MYDPKPRFNSDLKGLFGYLIVWAAVGWITGSLIAQAFLVERNKETIPVRCPFCNTLFPQDLP